MSIQASKVSILFKPIAYALRSHWTVPDDFIAWARAYRPARRVRLGMTKPWLAQEQASTPHQTRRALICKHPRRQLHQPLSDRTQHQRHQTNRPERRARYPCRRAISNDIDVPRRRDILNDFAVCFCLRLLLRAIEGVQRIAVAAIEQGLADLNFRFRRLTSAAQSRLTAGMRPDILGIIRVPLNPRDDLLRGRLPARLMKGDQDGIPFFPFRAFVHDLSPTFLPVNSWTSLVFFRMS